MTALGFLAVCAPTIIPWKVLIVILIPICVPIGI